MLAGPDLHGLYVGLRICTVLRKCLFAHVPVCDSEWLGVGACADHYETQPVPNPLAWFLHHNWKGFHLAEVATNHFVE